MQNKRVHRMHRKLRIRAKVSGTPKRPRLSVFRSNTTLYVQIVDDTAGTSIGTCKVDGKSVAKAKELGAAVAQMLTKHHISAAVFDRGGYQYHGVVKAIADAVREGGITI